MRITVLAGGVGAARFLRGLKAEAPDAEITVIGNTGDDITLFGLHVSPDLDTVMYTLGGGIDEEQGWGRAGDTFTVLAELAAYGAGPDWFGLGDLDIATHLLRTSMLAAGLPLSAATGGAVPALAARGDAAPDDRRPGRDPRRAGRRAGRPGAGGPCTSRSGGCGWAPRCPRPASSSPGAAQARPAPGCWRRSPRPT